MRRVCLRIYLIIDIHNDIEMSEKIILDACCGSRMFWFDKKNPNVLFIDNRSETVTAKDRDKIRTIEVNPDVIADFTNSKFGQDCWNTCNEEHRCWLPLSRVSFYLQIPNFEQYN